MSPLCGECSDRNLGIPLNWAQGLFKLFIPTGNISLGLSQVEIRWLLGAPRLFHKRTNQVSWTETLNIDGPWIDDNFQVEGNEKPDKFEKKKTDRHRIT